MSHELRTPLNGILGFAQILKRKRVDADVTSGLTIIEQSGAHLLTLINDILDLAKIEAGRLELAPTAVRLPSFLDSIVGIIRARAEAKQLTVAFALPPSLPEWVQADETKLRQILLNLLGNAVKFTDHGQVTLRVSSEFSVLSSELERATRETQNSKLKTQNSTTLRFAVEDTGPGIPADELARIFQPFEQGGERARREGGTGLGLAISRQLVRAMGGDIQVTSALGQGSTFWFDLAVPVLESLVHTPSAAQVVIGYAGPRRSVLVVDDIATNRAVLAELLTGVGFTVYQAANGQEGIAQAQARRPDLILMDRSMPVLEGLEAIRRIRQIAALQQTPIVAVSASVTAADRAASLAAGANAFVPKPIRLAELLEQISRLLNMAWVEAKPVAESEEAVPQAGLPPDEAQRLYILARQGSIVKIRERLDALERRGPQYSSCVTELRQQVLQPRMVNLNDIVSNIEGMLQRLIGEHIVLLTKLEEPLALVQADPGQLEQNLLNLVVNARDAMPQGGQLTIETANVELDEQSVMLAVSDSGAGMSPEVQARLFEPFFTTKELGQGTGLGLATCYGIVKQHGGSISVDSAVGQGTTIRIELPAQPGAHPTQAAPPAAVELPRGHETVLLVEDQADVRQFAARVLRGLGYTVVEAANGTEAIERALERPIQLLVTDVVMPALSGSELAAQLMGHDPDLRIIYMSGYTEDRVAQDAWAEVGVAFLSKPFSGADLAQLVRTTLDGRS